MWFAFSTETSKKWKICFRLMTFGGEAATVVVLQLLGTSLEFSSNIIFLSYVPTFISASYPSINFSFQVAFQRKILLTVLTDLFAQKSLVVHQFLEAFHHLFHFSNVQTEKQKQEINVFVDAHWFKHGG